MSWPPTSVAGLMSFAGYLGYLYGPVQELGELVVTIGAGVASGTRIVELLDHPVEVRDAPGAGELPRAYGHIRFERRRLSGGQQRRVAITRALLRDSPVLVLDEPTAGLDDLSAERLVHTLHRLAADRTVLVVTHDLRLAAGADTLLILDDGRITEPRRRTRPAQPAQPAQATGDGTWARLPAAGTGIGAA
ncbi:hypothetical protein FAIPA1_10387 [Frankia sp. AiPs1]|uniref:ATP-binding cassette domain-containing protein n=1 Tax=Frankia sp. AiPa1 TaxID=573492 RepID=UPI00202B3DE3|nr:ATP-binding cassette domain-containing protein [Frankia sp. AiPa1]MCL9758232.1 ATP-binding cassette domain-containing protein [Frankia sp. AiPa1]